MKIGDAIRRTGREEKVIQSIIWNSIISTFKEKTGKDITIYLESISLSGSTVIVKTKKPIVNTELSNIKKETIGISKTKLLKLGISFRNMDIKYI